MQENQPIGRFQKSLMLTKASWNTLKLDKELLTLPVIGFALSIVVIALAAIFAKLNPGEILYQVTSTSSTMPLTIEASVNIHPIGYICLFLVGLIVAALATYFNAAIIYGALERFKGNDPTIKGSLKAINGKLGSILIFSAFSYTIGFVITEIANRIPAIGGQIVAWLAGTAWGIASFFAIPGIVSSNKPVNPIQATKNSVSVMKKIWGESLISSFAITTIEAVVMIIYTLISVSLVAATVGLSAPMFLSISIGTLATIGLLAIALIFNVLQALLKAALYHYAITGESPAKFNKDLLRQAFTQKKAKKVFGS